MVRARLRADDILFATTSTQSWKVRAIGIAHLPPKQDLIARGAPGICITCDLHVLLCYQAAQSCFIEMLVNGTSFILIYAIWQYSTWNIGFEI